MISIVMNVEFNLQLIRGDTGGLRINNMIKTAPMDMNTKVLIMKEDKGNTLCWKHQK